MSKVLPHCELVRSTGQGVNSLTSQLVMHTAARIFLQQGAGMTGWRNSTPRPWS